MARFSSGALVLLMLVGMAGCAVDQGKVYVKDGKRYGVTSSLVWRGTWWNYYERGTSYADGGFWNDAAADLQEAIKQRARDGRRASTYGVHFIDYFPHRELGVVYYRQGRYPDAIRELETSLQSVDTAKAKFYLNKARRGQLEQTRSDAAAPRIVVTSPQDGLLTGQFTITVQGYVEDNTYVSAIAVNGQAQFIELAEPRLTFTQEIALQDGPNTIEIVAADLVGQLTRQRLTVTLDRQGPLLSLNPVEPVGTALNPRARLEGALSDSSGVARFTLAGQRVPLPPGTDLEFRQEVPLTPGMAGIPFEAEDAVGNITRGTIALAPGGKPAPVRHGSGAASPRWATLDFGQSLTDLGPVAAMPVHVAQRPDQAPPYVEFRNLEEAQVTTYYDAIYLEGEVRDDSPIVALKINGKPILHGKKQHIFFGYKAALKPGENRVVVEALDEPGNQAHKEVVVTREVIAAKSEGSRLYVALAPLKKLGDSTALADVAYSALRNALFAQKRFRLVEREKLDSVLAEQGLSQTLLVDEKTAARVGKIVAAEGLLFGSVVEGSPPEAMTVSVSFVDVETAVVLAEDDVYGEELKSQAAVRELMEGLALKLRNRFPLVEGLVTKAEERKVIVNLGSNKNLREHMKLIVFREGAPPTSVGEIRIEAVFDDTSQGVIQEPGVEVRQLDKVITK